MTNNISINTPQKLQEPNPFSIIYGNQGEIMDIADLTAKTPFDDLMEKEEREQMESTLDHREAQVCAISGILSYLFKDCDPEHVCIRAFLLAYTVNPSLLDIGGKITLKTIGIALGGMSKQRISQHLQKQDKEFPIKRRGAKSPAVKKIYSDIQKEAWRKKKAKGV